MPRKKIPEQSIAVFGGSGSGKTVLVSSFYGAAQEPERLMSETFHVVADDPGQGNRLHQNYLGMRDDSRVPAATRLDATTYSFTVRIKDGGPKNTPFHALRVKWYDYPGEWFEQAVSGPTEEARRVEAFRSLLSADVALVLVDGQQLLDHRGEEEKYLKSLFGNFRNGLLSLKDDLLPDGEPLVDFPRIWVLALSKADLLPDMDAYAFRDLLIGKAGVEIDELRRVFGGFVQASEALSVNDFVLLSSAKFAGDTIEVHERIGVDLLLPLAAVLPFERHSRWSRAKQLPRRVAESLLDIGSAGVGAFAAAMLGKVKLPGPIGIVQRVAGAVLAPQVVEEASRLAGDKLRKANADARARHDNLVATLTGFTLALAEAERQRVFVRSST